MTDVRLPVLIGLSDMVALFPRTARTTIYRWNTVRSGKRMLPEPIVRVGGSPLWTLEQLEEFAARRGLRIDPAALRALKLDQGHPA